MSDVSNKRLAMTSTEKSLSPAQRVVLQYLLNGLRNEEIAEHTELSSKTIKNHVANILAKTGTASRLELTVKVYKEREKELRRRLRVA